MRRIISGMSAAVVFASAVPASAGVIASRAITIINDASGPDFVTQVVSRELATLNDVSGLDALTNAVSRELSILINLPVVIVSNLTSREVTGLNDATGANFLVSTVSREAAALNDASGSDFLASAVSRTATSFNDVLAANPPPDNPYTAGVQPFRDVLQPGPGVVVTQGIGATGTPAEGSVSYAPIVVTFPVPMTTLALGQTVVTCNGTVIAPCPTVTGVSFLGGETYALALSGPVPPGGCATLTFSNVSPPKTLKYQALPGDVNFSGVGSASDLLALVNAINNGQAALEGNRARYDINRTGSVSSTDVLRLVQLFNGANSPAAFSGFSVAPCP